MKIKHKLRGISAALMLLSILACFSIYQAPVVRAASEFYVAPNGSPSGDGSIQNPWDLQTALNQPAAVKPGDIINLRGGTYYGPFESKLQGTASAPIVVRSNPGEWAVLDWYVPITLATAIDTTTTTITLSDASPLLRFPTNSIVVGDLDPESMYVKSISGNTLTVLRGNSGTTAQSFPAGATVRIGQPNLTVHGQDTWFRDFEVTNSYAQGRVLPDANPDQSNRPDRRYGGLWTDGTDNKFIDVIIHDVGDGFFVSDQALGNTEIYGVLDYSNGWTAPDRGHGHGFYLRSNTGSLTIEDTMSFNNHATGEKVFGYAAYGNNVTFDGYVGFGNQESNFFLGTSQYPMTNITVQNSYIYDPPTSWGGGGMTMGWSGVQNNDIKVLNNYVAGRTTALDLELWQSAIVTGNTLWVSGNTGANNRLGTLKAGTGKTAQDYTWNNNTYYDNDYGMGTDTNGTTYNMYYPGGPNTVGGGVYNYNLDWKRVTPFDANSTYNRGTAGGTPTVNSVFVQPNKYETGRSNVIVYNWQNLDSVTADLSSTGLQSGDNYEVLDAQNYFGAPVATGVYSGGSISIPMTSTAIYQAVGTLAISKPHTLKEFGTFVVRKTSSQVVTPPTQTPTPDTTAPVVSVSAPISSTIVSGASVPLSASAADNMGVMGVQFQVDGANYGSELSTAPYTSTLDSTKLSNGTHTITAIARDAAGNTKTSAVVSVDVENVQTPVTPPANIGGAGGSSGGGAGAGVPVLPPVVTPSEPTSTPLGNSAQVRLINDNGTFYLIQNGERQGITNPDLLLSRGLEFRDATTATSADLAVPLGPNLTPGNGALVKTKEDKTVYLVSNGQKHGFTTEQVFLGQGFKWTSILTVTQPELDQLSVGSIINNANSAHLEGIDVNINGTVYWVGPDGSRHAYSSLAIYNSWHKENDFSFVVPANSPDLQLPEANAVVGRVLR